MDRLEAVAHVGKCACHDHAHGIIEIRPSNLVFDVDGQYAVTRHRVSVFLEAYLARVAGVTRCTHKRSASLSKSCESVNTRRFATARLLSRRGRGRNARKAAVSASNMPEIASDSAMAEITLPDESATRSLGAQLA